MNFSAINLIIQDGVLKDLKEKRKNSDGQECYILERLISTILTEDEMKLTKIRKIKYFVKIKTSIILNPVVQLQKRKILIMKIHIKNMLLTKMDV